MTPKKSTGGRCEDSMLLSQDGITEPIIMGIHLEYDEDRWDEEVDGRTWSLIE